MKEKQKGITLIALVVTIIILLILAGVAISTLSGDNGLIARAKQAKIQTEYTAAKEKINMELMQIQTDCTAAGKEYNIKEIVLSMKESTEITIEKCFYKEVAAIKEGIEVDTTNLESIAVSVDEYSEYKFLIGESADIEGVLKGKITETTAKTDFTTTEEFEQNIFGTAIIQENTKLTYTTVPATYTNQDSIKMLLIISNEKGIKTIEFPDGESVECYGRTEYSKDYPIMVNGTYTYKITDMQGNEETKEITIDLIDKLKPIDFTPEIQKEGSTITITPNGDDAEADETSSKSGIAYYEYYLIDESNKESKYENNIIKNLNLEKYKVYVIAYDKAGNSKKSNIVEIEITRQLKSIMTVMTNSYGIDMDGNWWGWGNNNYGELGNGNTIKTQLTPILIANTLEKKFTQIGVGNDYTIALDNEGNIWSWGRNEYGQLGDGTTTDRLIPTQITEGIIFTEIRRGIGTLNNAALDNNGNIWKWGYNGRGEVGNGTKTHQLTPVKITEGTIFTKVEPNDNAIALDQEGNIWSWGSNQFGQVGNGTTTDQLTPVQITEGTIFIKVERNGNHTIALDQEGNIWSWGYNVNGEVGNGTTEDQLTPIQITTEKVFTEIKCGMYHNLALDNEGNIWSWGYNVNGEVGNGTTENQLTPTQITTDRIFVKIKIGNNYSVALDNDGNIWSWGQNNRGQVGNGTLKKQTTPVQITLNTKFVHLDNSNFSDCTLALDIEGNIWGWGQNNRGQVGNGSTVEYVTKPTLIK